MNERPADLTDAINALGTWIDAYYIVYPSETEQRHPDINAVYIKMVYSNSGRPDIFKTRTFDDEDRQTNMKAALIDAYGILYEIVWRETLRI